jgi:hypothetical protein
MSEDFTRWIPISPTFVPTDADAARAVQWLRARAPKADDITVEFFPIICFIDCGANLEAIRCRRCGAELSSSWWQSAMDAAVATAFENRTIRLPCCDETDSLDMLRDEWSCGFARFVLEARNASIGKPTAADDEEVAALLGTPVRHVLAHY